MKTHQPQSVTQRVSGQAIWSVLSKVATTAGTLGVSVVTVRMLGAHDFGVWSLARNMVIYVALIGAFGLDRSLLRFVPELETKFDGKGIRHLFFFILGIQFILLTGICIGLVSFAPLWKSLFMPEIGPLLPFICLVSAAFVFKETIYQLHFALARTSKLSCATTITAIVWLVLTWVFLDSGRGAAGVLIAQSLALIVTLVFLLPSLTGCFRVVSSRFKNRAVECKIETRRLIIYSATLMGGSIVNLIVQRQSELFFLAAVLPVEEVGFYDLGYSLPQLGMELIPLSLYGIIISSITASYTRDPSRLGLLVGWYYKLLAVMTIPFAILGVLWSDKLIVLLYGSEMAPAGPIAAIFSFIHLLPFISVPIGTALNVKEQAYRTLPFGLLQVSVNITLDFLLIPDFGIPGAIAAVILTFFLVTPLTIRYAVRFTGPLEFPFRWIGRLILAFSPAMLLVFTRPWVHGWTELMLVIIVSILLMIVGFRYGRLIGKEELHRLNQIDLPGKKWIISILTV